MKIGNIVKHVFRKRTLYLVIDTDNPNEIIITKVTQGKGYPLAEDDNFYKATTDQLTVIDHEPGYENAATYSISLIREKQNKALEGDYSQVDEKTHQKFVSLAGALSPENLACDGELPKTETQKRLKSLKKEWKELEKKVGFKVSENSVWNRFL